MPDRNDQPVVAEEIDDFLDDDLDLDELPEVELADAGPGEPDMIDDDAADAIVDEELELSNGRAPLDLVEPDVGAPVGETEALEDEEFLEPAFEPPPAVPPVTIASPSADLEARIAKLEAAARALAAAEVTRDRKKVRRKVSAASTGAGAIGAVPILLQITGAFSLDPEIVATISTAAAAIGAFVAGWLTPERKPSIPTAVALETLSNRS